MPELLIRLLDDETELDDCNCIHKYETREVVLNLYRKLIGARKQHQTKSYLPISQIGVIE